MEIIFVNLLCLRFKEKKIFLIEFFTFAFDDVKEISKQNVKVHLNVYVNWLKIWCLIMQIDLKVTT
jgi:hypothetical protein